MSNRRVAAALAVVEQPGFLQQVRAQAAAGRLTVDELRDRIDSRGDEGTALVVVAAEFSPEGRGVYWFCAVAADRAGNKAASEPAAVRVPANL